MRKKWKKRKKQTLVIHMILIIPITYRAQTTCIMAFKKKKKF